MYYRYIYLSFISLLSFSMIAQEDDKLISPSFKSTINTIDSLLDASVDNRMSAPSLANSPAKEALKLSLNLKDTSRIIISINHLAMAFKVNGELNQAISTILQTDQYANAYDNIALNGSSNLIKGHIYNDLSSFNEALKYYRIALDNFEKIKDSSGLGFTYSGIGIIYYDKGDIKNALTNYLNAEKFWPTHESLNEKSDLWNNLGAAYAEIKKWKLAERYYFLALKHYEKNNWTSDMAMVNYNLGELNMLSKNYKQSEKYYLKSLTIGTNSKNGVDIEWALLGLYELFKKQNKLDVALSYHEQYSKLKDSIQSVKNNQEIQQLENFYNEQKKRLESEAKSKLYKANSINSNKQSELYKIGIWIIVINGLILIGLGLFLFIRMKAMNIHLQQINVEIKDKSKLLDTALKEKELLLKEVHHRVKNNLQIISSLLNLQKFNLEDEAAITALEESKDRIQAISLVHQKLYQSENYSYVNFQTYLFDLVDHQQYLYDNQEKKIETTISCPETMIDLDTAVPLGLILSELITNCYKHAFVKTENPQINISLSKHDKPFSHSLKIMDNGCGLPDDFNIDSTESLGMEIAKTLTDQIGGEIHFKNDSGSIFFILFSLDS